jgi:uncharacterized protein YraI
VSQREIAPLSVESSEAGHVIALKDKTMNCKSLMFGGLLLVAGATAANAAVVTGDLNLRSGPGTGYRVIDTMPAGSYVDVVGCTGSWCQVQFGGMTGYASASYLGVADSYAAAPVYVEPPIYADPYPYYAAPAIGFGCGLGSGWGGWHHRGHHHHHHHH